MARDQIQSQIDLLKSSENLPPIDKPESDPFAGFNPQVIPPKLPDAPDLNTEPTGRMKALRAALIVAAGAAGGGDAAAALAYQFRQEDADLSKQIQQDFANRMGIAQEEGTNLQRQVSSAESDRSARQSQANLDEAKRRTDFDIQQESFDRRQAVLNGMLAAAQLEIQQAQLAGRDAAHLERKYEMLGQLRNALNDQLRAIPEPDKKVSQLEVIGIAESLADASRKSGNKKATAQQFMGQAQEQILGMRNQSYLGKLSEVRKNYIESPAFKAIRDSYADTPQLQMYMDLMFQSVPGPGNPNGDPAAFETGLQGLMRSDPDAFAKIRDGAIKDWTETGRYPNENASAMAFQDFANKSKESPDLWDLPPAGSFKSAPDIRGQKAEKALTTYFPPAIMLKQAAESGKAVKSAVDKVRGRKK